MSFEHIFCFFFSHLKFLPCFFYILYQIKGKYENGKVKQIRHRVKPVFLYLFFDTFMIHVDMILFKFIQFISNFIKYQKITS